MQIKILYIVTAVLWINTGSVLYAQKKTLTLTEALEMAKQGNKSLQIQFLEEIHSQEMSRETKSNLMPSVSANLGYSHYFDRQVIFLPGSFVGTTNPVEDVAVGGRNAYNGVISLQQPILALGAHQLNKASKINEVLEREKTADLKSRVALQVSTRYLNMLMMNRQLDLLEQSLERNHKALRDARSLYVQGRSLKTDTLRSYIAVENIKSSVSYLKNSIEVSGMELKRLIGWQESEIMELTDQLEEGIDRNSSDFYQLDEALALAEENRKDLSIQKLSMDLQQKRVKAAKAFLWPMLFLIGQYQLQAQADDLKMDYYAWPNTSFLGLQLSIPIFSGNRSHAQISQAKIRSYQEEIRLRDLTDGIKTELATNISKRKEAVTQLDIQEMTVKSAELNHHMIDERFKNGLSSRLELTDAELALTQAKINYLHAIYNLRMLQVQWQQALGLLSL